MKATMVALTELTEGLAEKLGLERDKVRVYEHNSGYVRLEQRVEHQHGYSWDSLFTENLVTKRELYYSLYHMNSALGKIRSGEFKVEIAQLKVWK